MVCLYVRVVRMCLHVHVHTCVSVHMYIRTYVCAYICCMHICMHHATFTQILISPGFTCRPTPSAIIAQS